MILHIVVISITVPKCLFNKKNMEIVKAEYVASYVREEQCPNDDMPEFAFIGRSNVGKSSLINTITGRKDLAKVSKQPGKTQKLNFFNIEDAWYLVDLPGYGYAKTPKKLREEWIKMIKFYLKNRQKLALAFVLLDSRHTLQKIDLEFLTWCGEVGLPIAIIYTKCDKPSEWELNKNLTSIRNGVLQFWEEMPPQFMSSSNTNQGREEILTYITDIVKTIQEAE